MTRYRRPVALLDANVLYPAQLRDFLMYQAAAGVFAPRWSPEIEREWMGNLLSNRPDLVEARLMRTRRKMREHVDEALVTGYEHLIPGLSLPDSGDRHVLAAAIKCQADVVVTLNVRHFPDDELKRHGVVAKRPDDFCLELFLEDPEGVSRNAKKHLASLKDPPKTREEFLTDLKQGNLPKTAALLGSDWRHSGLL